ncbi:hypothetical protein HQ520_04125 [bacterium]|nr:hypothetical protein [bacterium]
MKLINLMEKDPEITRIYDQPIFCTESVWRRIGCDDTKRLSLRIWDMVYMSKTAYMMAIEGCDPADLLHCGDLPIRYRVNQQERADYPFQFQLDFATTVTLCASHGLSKDIPTVLYVPTDLSVLFEKLGISWRGDGEIGKTGQVRNSRAPMTPAVNPIVTDLLSLYGVDETTLRGGIEFLRYTTVTQVQFTGDIRGLFNERLRPLLKSGSGVNPFAESLDARWKCLSSGLDILDDRTPETGVENGSVYPEYIRILLPIPMQGPCRTVVRLVLCGEKPEDWVENTIMVQSDLHLKTHMTVIGEIDSMLH